MARLRLGIIGCGSITHRGLLPHLSLADARDIAQVVALCSRTVSRAQGLADEYGIGHVFGSVEDMLAWHELDAVLVASPIPLHYEQVRQCLQAGLHVHTQKTLARTYSEGQELRHLAASRELVLAASPGQILLPAYRKARDYLLEGAVGQLYLAWGMNVSSGHEQDPLVRDPSWYYEPGGGPLEDMGIYNIHALIDLIGPPKSVSAVFGRPLAEKQWGEKKIRVDTDDNAGLLLDFGDGVIGMLSTAFAFEPEVVRWGHLAIVGDRGAIEIRRSPTARGQYELVRRSAEGVEVSLLGHGLEKGHEDMEEAHVYVDIRDFIHAVSERRAPGASVDTACTALAILDAAAASAKSGKAVPIHLD